MVLGPLLWSKKSAGAGCAPSSGISQQYGPLPKPTRWLRHLRRGFDQMDDHFKVKGRGGVVSLPKSLLARVPTTHGTHVIVEGGFANDLAA
jgi:hypothetical protein